jgi:hypothetical protein
MSGVQQELAAAIAERDALLEVPVRPLCGC